MRQHFLNHAPKVLVYNEMMYISNYYVKLSKIDILLLYSTVLRVLFNLIAFNTHNTVDAQIN